MITCGPAKIGESPGRRKIRAFHDNALRYKRLHQKFAVLRAEDGSASVELVIFAMPLFIPLLMLASHAMAVSSSKIETSHLARTALRAFVTAPSTPLGHARIQQVIKVSDSRELDDFGNSSRFSYLIECRQLPCIQPSNRVRITLKDVKTGVGVAATLYTDQWIKGEQGFLATEKASFFGYRDATDIEEEISPLLEVKEFADQIREFLDVLRQK